MNTKIISLGGVVLAIFHKITPHACIGESVKRKV